MLDYFSLIHKYYAPGTRTYKIFVVHAVLVTNKALAIGRRLGLPEPELDFIQEAAMLHDLGVIKVDSEKMDCHGELPYIAHGVAGAEMLRSENLMAHALVAERHVGVGLTQQEIVARDLPLPHQDFQPVSLAEQIITYADCFFSKREATLWQEETSAQIKTELASYNDANVTIFEKWEQQFNQ